MGRIKSALKEEQLTKNKATGRFLLCFLLSSLENFHYVHCDLFWAMDVHMFVFMAGYVYVGPESRLLN